MVRADLNALLTVSRDIFCHSPEYRGASTVVRGRYILLAILSLRPRPRSGRNGALHSSPNSYAPHAKGRFSPEGGEEVARVHRPTETGNLHPRGGIPWISYLYVFYSSLLLLLLAS